jgi:hypothetical protein
MQSGLDTALDFIAFCLFAATCMPSTVTAEADCRLRNKLMATLRQSRTRLSRPCIELSTLPSCVIPAFCEGGICRIFIGGDEILVKLLRLEYRGQATEDAGMEGSLSHLAEIKFVHCRPWPSTATLADACTPTEMTMAAGDDATPADIADALWQYG